MQSEKLFQGRLAIQQRVLPNYRMPFFDLLAQSCSQGLSVFAGQPSLAEGITPAQKLETARYSPTRNTHFLEPSSLFYQCWQNDIIDWLTEWDPQALIISANPRIRSNKRAIAWMGERRRPVLGWGLGAPPTPGVIAFIWDKSRKRYLQKLDGVIAYSQRGAREYEARGIPAERIFVATNAVTPPPTDPPKQRRRKPGEELKLLFVGRLQLRKRIDLLLQACAALSVSPALTIIGDGPARKHFENLAQRLYPKTKFPGAVHGLDLGAYYREADLFVLPGTGGLAVQQAMSYGLPVLVAQGDGTQDDLVRPENGWQIQPGSLTALIQALENAIQDTDRLNNMGNESHRIIKEEININTMVEAFIDALNSIVH